MTSSKRNLKLFVYIQLAFSLSIMALIFGEKSVGYELSLFTHVKPNVESFYLMVVIIGLFLCKQRHDAFLLVRVHDRMTIFRRNLFTVLVHAWTSSFIYWIIIGSFIQHLVVPSLLIDACLFALNGCLMGSVFFTLTYLLPKANILPLLICMALIFTVCFARMFASPHLNNAYNLFIAQSWFKGNFVVTTVSCLLLIFAFNYLNAELVQKIEIY